MQDQTEFYKTIGTRIKEIRIAKGISQAERAEKAKLSSPVISGIENGRSKSQAPCLLVYRILYSQLL